MHKILQWFSNPPPDTPRATILLRPRAAAMPARLRQPRSASRKPQPVRSGRADSRESSGTVCVLLP
jgi:hypothetical protein